MTRQTVRQAQRVRTVLEGLLPPAAGGATRTQPRVQERVVRRLLAPFDPFLPLVQPGMDQARARVLDGPPVPSRAKVLSLFEPPNVRRRAPHVGRSRRMRAPGHA